MKGLFGEIPQTPEGGSKRRHKSRPHVIGGPGDPMLSVARSQLPPTDPNVKPADRHRLRGQNGLILDRLRRGQASSAELAQLSLKYTSRVSDLRKHGHDVRHKDGTYTLYVNGKAVG